MNIPTSWRPIANRRARTDFNSKRLQVPHRPRTAQHRMQLGVERAQSNQEDLMKEMQPYRQRGTKFAGPRSERERRNMRATGRMSVHREINQNMVEAFAEVCLLNRQVAAQPMAIRMALAGRMVPMPIRRRVVIVITTSVRSKRPVASSCVVHIMPATSKHSMDEQRSTQQATKKGTHHVFNRVSTWENWRSASS
jgi:hypothetical protein